MNNSKTTQRPSHNVYSVKEGNGDKDFWMKLGVAFAHKDGMGFSIILEALPVDRKLTIRPIQKKELTGQ